ncbi:hypothetical protein CA606_20015 [Caulobacter vibrioides]|uniref:Uncharacterized protein n=1 Tax=Caulobacter vibrioides TaxID=155892 RepID=A0A291IDA9_CAUVI|nr:hypothetical protein CA606_20015 [Caulobacter vibrioides]
MVTRSAAPPQTVQPLFDPALSGKRVPTHPPTASRRAPPSLHERGILIGRPLKPSPVPRSRIVRNLPRM